MDAYQAFEPPTAALEDAPSEPLQLADRGTRLGASILDALIMVFGAIPFFIPFILLAGRRGWGADSAVWTALFGGIALWLAGFFTWNGILLHRNGQTVAKRILKIKVVRSNGDRVPLWRFVVLRYLPTTLMGALPFVGGIANLVDACLIFRESRQCLHDTIADTIVIQA